MAVCSRLQLRAVANLMPADVPCPVCICMSLLDMQACSSISSRQVSMLLAGHLLLQHLQPVKVLT